MDNPIRKVRFGSDSKTKRIGSDFSGFAFLFLHICEKSFTCIRFQISGVTVKTFRKKIIFDSISISQVAHQH